MGGSESRFICKPLTTDKYLMVTAPHDNHQKVVLGPRDPEDRYQKVVFKTDDNCLNIRFDNHPQPYVCATQSGDKWTLKMERSYDSDQAGHFQWKLVILGKRKTDRGRWKVKNGYKLNWMNTKHHSLKAVLINSAANMVLSYDCVSNELRLVKVSKGNVHTLSDEAVWELECVDHNYNSTQATIPAGVFVPFGAVAVIGEAAATALPPAQLLPFFEYLRLLAPMEDETDGAVTEYSDLPSCDVDALYRPSSGCGTPAPLIFWLTCGFCPVGLFRLLITHLSSPHVPSELKWELCSGDLFRNKATFRVGRDQDELTLIARPMMYEVWINREDDEGSAIPLTQVCSHVRSTIDKAITTVKSSFDSILTIDHRIGFYCQRPACGTTAGGHPAVFKDIGDARPVCLSADKASPLTPEQRMWLHVEKLPLIGRDPTMSDERFHTVLKPSDLMEVCDKLDDVKVKWQNIGLHLDLPNKVLQDIDADHVQYANNQKRLRAMILAWLSRRLTPPTWQSLIDALEHYVIGENATAEDIRTYVLSKEA